MSDLLRDVRYAARALVRRPAFTAAAVVALALCIGASVGVFSFVDALFLRPLAVPEADRLVRVFGRADGRRFDVFSYPNYRDLRDRCRSFAGLAAHRELTATLGIGGRPESIPGELVSGNYFATLGVGVELGRPLLPADDGAAGASPVVVLSDALWRQRLGGDARVVGSSIHLNGHPFTVVGVARPGFSGAYDASATAFWVPIAMADVVRPQGLSLERRGWGWLQATGRLQPGVTRGQAQAEVDAVAALLRQEYPEVNHGIGFELVAAAAMPERYTASTGRVLLFLHLVIAAVLLVGCANIASFLLARVRGRRRETAVRQALGAGRRRLVRQWMVESLLLAGAGGAAGVALSTWLTRAAARVIPPEAEFLAPRLALDVRVLAFALGLTALAAAVFGVLPAIRAAGTDPATALRQTDARGGERHSRLHGAFVVGQVAVSLAVLVVAGLLVRGVHAAASFDPGFDTRGLALASFNLTRHGYTPDRSAEFYDRLQAGLRSVPGVRGVTVGQVVPLSPGRESLIYPVPDAAAAGGSTTADIASNLVGPGYFSVMGIPLVSGRDFDERDVGPNAPPVIVINETMARRFWPGRDPVGQRLVYSDGPSLEIVGVARDITYFTIGEAPQPYVYRALGAEPASGLTIHVRTDGDARALLGTIAAQASALDPELPVEDVMTFEALRRLPLFPYRAMAAVASAFGVLSLLLTVIGVYGLTAYSVTLRTREIGVRVALGAAPAAVSQMVLRDGVRLAGAGVVLGGAAAAAIAHALESRLIGVGAIDPIAFAAAGGLLGSLVLLASWLPARRAARLDPIAALRCE